MGKRSYKIAFEHTEETFECVAGCVGDAIAIACERTGFSIELIDDVEENDHGEINNLRGAALCFWMNGAPIEDEEEQNND